MMRFQPLAPSCSSRSQGSTSTLLACQWRVAITMSITHIPKPGHRAVGICPIWLLKVPPMPRLPIVPLCCCFVSAEGIPYDWVRSDLPGPACPCVLPASTGRAF